MRQNQDQPTMKTVLANTFVDRHTIVVAILAVVIFITSLILINVRSTYRHDFIAMQQQLKQQNKLQSTWTQLLLEEGTWSQYGRVKSLAKSDLNMIVPGPKQMRIFKP